MRKGGGGAKGAQYERGICGKLSLWVSNLARNDVFWRSAISGGRAHIMSKRKRGRAFNAQSGDITAIHESGGPLLNAFVIECKHLKDIRLMRAVTGRKHGLPEIWRKLARECDAAGSKLPMLIARQNRLPDVLMTNRDGANILRSGSKGLRTRFILPPLDLYGFLFRDVINEIDFDDIKDVCRSRVCQESSSPPTSTSPHGHVMSIGGKSSHGSKSKSRIVRERL